MEDGEKKKKERAVEREEPFELRLLLLLLAVAQPAL